MKPTPTTLLHILAHPLSKGGAGLLFALGVWQVFAGLYANPLFPSPREVFEAGTGLWASGELVAHSLHSLKRVLVGFGFGAVFGVCLALLFSRVRILGELLEPIIGLLRPIPPIAWIPIAILILGLGDGPAYFIVSIGAFFPTFTNSYFGFTSLPKIYQNVARSFQLSEIVYIWNILIRSTLPYIFTGLRIGIGMAWMSVIAAELIGAQSGLGYFIQLNRLLLRMDHILVGMVAIGVIGFGLNIILLTLEKKFTVWNQ
jgi:ABC-type nitrate/sulfonate/bicarbonate transport system permease component